MKDESADAADRQCAQHLLGAASREGPSKGAVPHIHIFPKIWLYDSEEGSLSRGF